MPKQNITEIRFGDSLYPPQLLPLSGAPRQLFIRGDPLTLAHQPIVAVIGTRKISSYGRLVVQQLIPEFVQCGLTIVSGLALGTDALVHESTLAAGGCTIAVLGSGVDAASISPRTNAGLAEKILATHGAVISEYPPCTEAMAFRFPERNRIIAGLVQAVVIIEGSMKSGTLITARHALEFGREVFAVPGPITAETSRAPNWLIAQGAAPLLKPADLLDRLGTTTSLTTQPTQRNLPLLSSQATQLFELIKKAPISAEGLIDETRLDTSTVLTALSELELAGAITRLSNLYSTSR